MDYQIIDATNWSQETGSLKLVSSSKIQFNFPFNMDREQSSVKIEMQRASADETCMSVEGDKIFIPVIRKLCSDTRSDVELISNRRPCENMINPNIKLILNKPRKAPMDTLNTTNLITASPYLEQSSSTTDMVPLSRMNTLQKCVVCLNHIKRMSTEERKSFRSMEKQLRMIIQDYIRFDLPKYKNEYTNSGNEWFRRSALYATSGNIHTDRKLTILPRQAQGFGIPLAYLSEAVTAVASAFTYYLMYKTGKNAYHSIKEHTYGIQSAQVMSALKTYMLELIGAMRIIYCWYTGQVTLDQALLMLLGLGGWIAAKHYLLSALLPTLKPFPADSTTRETQAFDPPSLAHSIISILILLGLGSGSTLDAKSVMGSIRGLSATLLTVKTVENVFMAVITYLPDIIQVFVCDHFPVFGQYMYMTTNVLYRRFVEVSHDLMSRSVTDVLFNSHNLAKFLQYRDICKNIVMDKTAFKVHLYKTIPEILSWYDLMYRRAEELGLLPGKRKLPFVIWLSGDPGIGKSTMVKELAEIGIGHLFKDLTPDEKDQGIVNFLRSEEISKYVYTHNTSNKYFDGYNNQPIFVLNDYLQFTQEKEEQWLIRFVDTNDCPLEVSSVDNPATGVKGEVRFTSRIIIVTSNISHLYNSTVVTNLDAFNRRRDFVVNMNWKENVRQVDFRNFDYSWCNFTKHPALPHSNALILPFKDKIDFWQCLSHELTMYLYQTGHMHLDHAHPTQQATIKDALASMEAFEYQWDLKLWATWNEIMKKAETKFFGIPLKYLLPLIVGGTSATYLIYKSWVPSLLAQLTTQSMSGDMATQRLQKKTKPLTRTTMSNRQNDTELALRICKNMVRITTVIKDVHNKLITQVVWGWSYGGSMILTPKHLWKRGESEVQIGDIVAIERGSSQFFFTVEKDNIYMDPDSDIAVINVSGDVPPFKSEKNLVIGGEFQVDEAGEDGMILIMTKGPQTDEAIVPTIVPVRAYLTDAPYSDEYGVTYEGRNIWQYNHRLVKGDCGAPMLIKTKAGMKIAGIHVAGDAFSGNSEVITQAVLDQADQYFTKRETQGFCADAEFVEEEFFDAESDLEGNFFYLGKVKTPPYQKSDTQIVKSPLFEALQPHMTEPAVLSPTDKRMDSVMSPIISSVSKYGQQVLPFNMDLMNAAFDIVLDMYQPIKIHKLKVFSHEEAINAKYTPNLEKLDLTTSAGYPWNTKGKSKKDLFNKDKDGYITIKPELQNVINKNENLLDKKTMFPYTLVTTLKDERVSLKKVKIGKTRTFMNFPVEYTVMMRRYFDDFIDKETFHALEIGTTVGVNIYSSQWHQLFLKLNEFDCVTDGDFKAFDGTIRPEFFKFYSRLVNSFYKDEFSNHRHLLCVGCCFSPMFVLDKVYMKLQGNPSGSRLTTSFNSFVNRMYVVMSMLKNIPTQYRNRVFFNENVKIFAHGDDHIIGFNNIVLDSWDAHTLRDFMKVHGIDYTSSNKDQELARHRPLNQCFYLKSHFVYNKETGMYQAGLDKEVIQEMVSWQRDNSLESTEMIVQTAQRYAYFWGREYFTEIYNKLEDIIIKKRLRINLIDYNSLDQYYLYNGQMDFSYV